MLKSKRQAPSLKRQRPTAVNLFWGVDRVLNKAKATKGTVEQLKAAVIEEAQKIADEDAAQNHAIGKHGAELIKDGDTILTHCNAGELCAPSNTAPHSASSEPHGSRAKKSKLSPTKPARYSKAHD